MERNIKSSSTYQIRARIQEARVEQAKNKIEHELQQREQVFKLRQQHHSAQSYLQAQKEEQDAEK